MKNLLSSILILVTGNLIQAQNGAMETITFNSLDGVQITADYYRDQQEDSPLLILYHQAGWSRGEYRETAPKLNQLGYNCLAVDLRSGGEVNGVRNETKVSAVNKMKPTNYLDAYQDIEASVDYALNTLNHDRIILIGSSYSAALVVKYAGENGDKIAAALAYSPGEYFKSFGKPDNYITASAAAIDIPFYITSSRNEKKAWWDIYEAIPSERKEYFIPETSGNHGSRALWQKFTDHKSYWNSLVNFLSNIP